MRSSSTPRSSSGRWRPLPGVLYAAVPRWRDQLRWPLVVVVAIAVGSIWVAYISGAGRQGRERPLHRRVRRASSQKHEDRAQILRWVASGFAVVAFAAAWWHTRTGAMRTVLPG